MSFNECTKFVFFLMTTKCFIVLHANQFLTFYKKQQKYKLKDNKKDFWFFEETGKKLNTLTNYLYAILLTEIENIVPCKV